MIEIIPAIMPQRFEHIEEDVALVVGYARYVQVDVMDGKFVRPKTWPYVHDNKGTFNALISESEGLPRWDSINYEIDLLVSHPEEVVEEWIIAGASRIIIHIESTTKLDEIVRLFKERFAYDPDMGTRDVELVLSLNIDTPTDTILPYLEDIDGVQFMGIAQIGYQGQPFDERVLEKIREFHNAHPKIKISVDGGVNFDTVRDLYQAGAHRLVSGSAVFNADNPHDSLRLLKQSTIE